MANILYEVRSSPAVDAFYDRLSREDQMEMSLIVSALRVDPWPDDERKIELSSDLGGMFAYDDGDWIINYKVVGRTIHLYGAWHRGSGSSAGAPGGRRLGAWRPCHPASPIGLTIWYTDCGAYHRRECEMTTTNVVTVSDAAAEKAKMVLEQRGRPQGALRLFVAGGSCSGPQYGMAIAESPDAEDTVFTAGDVTFVIDPESLPYVAGAEIDYVEETMRSGFTIFNPSVQSAGGGCGGGCTCGHG